MKWLRCRVDGQDRVGHLEGDTVHLHAGDDPFVDPPATGETLPLAGLPLLPPCRPRLIVGLWNNFRAAAEKNGWPAPAEPLWFLKSPHAAAGPGQTIPAPPAEVGRVAYEGELVLVIGRRTARVSPADAAAHVFGCTCGNDVTAIEVLQRDPSFPQWSRAKSLDGFAAFGPWIETATNVAAATLRTRVGGRERQNYPLSDMFFAPLELVSRLSHDLTLEAGDLVYCGTSLGVLPMKPGSVVEVEIDGIGVLSNPFGTSA